MLPYSRDLTFAGSEDLHPDTINRLQDAERDHDLEVSSELEQPLAQGSLRFAGVNWTDSGDGYSVATGTAYCWAYARLRVGEQITGWRINLLEAAATALDAELYKIDAATGDATSISDVASSPGTGVGDTTIEYALPEAVNVEDGYLYGLRLTAHVNDAPYEVEFLHQWPRATDIAISALPDGMDALFEDGDVLPAATLNALQDAILDHETQLRGPGQWAVPICDLAVGAGFTLYALGFYESTGSGKRIRAELRVRPGCRLKQWICHGQDDGTGVFGAGLYKTTSPGGVKTLVGSLQASSGSGSAENIGESPGELIEAGYLYFVEFVANAPTQRYLGVDVIVDRPASHPDRS